MIMVNLLRKWGTYLPREFFAFCHVPALHLVLLLLLPRPAPAEEGIAFRGERERLGNRDMGGERSQLLACLRLPQFDDTLAVAAGYPPTERRLRDRIDSYFVFENTQLFSGRGVQQPEIGIVGSH